MNFIEFQKTSEHRPTPIVEIRQAVQSGVTFVWGLNSDMFHVSHLML